RWTAASEAAMKPTPLAKMPELPPCMVLPFSQMAQCRKEYDAIFDQCRVKLGITSYAEAEGQPESQLKLAECEEAAAAKTRNKAVASQLRMFAQNLRQLAKPGVRIGMTAQQVIEETQWGAPEHVNRTTTAAGTREQWV